MRTQTITRELYQYAELSPEAQERAREWWTQAAGETFSDDECVTGDAKAIAELFGLSINRIYWTGFWSQGDGASFSGAYSYKRGALSAVKAYAPQDEELHRIAAELQRLQARNFYKLRGHVTQRGHYYHEYSMEIDVDRDDRAPYEDDAASVAECLRDFARWIYRALESEYEYQTSDEVAAESIEANAYEFDAEGHIA